MNDAPYGDGQRSAPTVQLTPADLTDMATAAQDAATAVRDTKTMPAEDSAHASGALLGWETGAEVVKAWSRWMSKAAACADSVDLFGEALTLTSQNVVATDDANAFSFPDGSPIPGGEPPWNR